VPDIQDPGPGRKLQKRYRLIGTTPAPFLSPELVPVVLIDDLSDDEPTDRWGTAAQVEAAAVGALSQTAIRNGSQSGIIIENISCLITLSSGGQWGAFQAGPTLTTPTSPFWQDQTLAGAPQAEISQGVDVGAVVDRIARGASQGDDPILVDFLNYRLGQAQKIHLTVIQVNIRLEFWWKWTERALE